MASHTETDIAGPTVGTATTPSLIIRGADLVRGTKLLKSVEEIRMYLNWNAVVHAGQKRADVSNSIQLLELMKDDESGFVRSDLLVKGKEEELGLHLAVALADAKARMMKKQMTITSARKVQEDMIRRKTDESTAGLAVAQVQRKLGGALQRSLQQRLKSVAEVAGTYMVQVEGVSRQRQMMDIAMKAMEAKKDPLVPIPNMLGMVKQLDLKKKKSRDGSTHEPEALKYDRSFEDEEQQEEDEDHEGHEEAEAEEVDKVSSVPSLDKLHVETVPPPPKEKWRPEVYIGKVTEEEGGIIAERIPDPEPRPPVRGRPPGKKAKKEKADA